LRQDHPRQQMDRSTFYDLGAPLTHPLARMVLTIFAAKLSDQLLGLRV